MEYFRKISESASLVSGMASRLDIDIGERLAHAPDINARNYAQMVMRCANCPKHAACAALQEANPALDEVPDYCRNRDVFSRS